MKGELFCIVCGYISIFVLSNKAIRIVIFYAKKFLVIVLLWTSI